MTTKTFSIPTPPADGELSLIGETLRKGKRIVFATIGDIALLDVAARNSTNPETHKLLDTLAQRVAAAKLKLQYVTDVRGFFNPKARWDQFLKTGGVEGLELTEEERKVAETVAELRAKFEATFKVPVVTLPYTRLALKKDEDPLKGITFTKTSVKRGGRSLTNKTLESLWTKASTLWAKGQTGYGSYRSYDGYYESPRINEKSITIGCKTISRQTMEALATKFGWPDPQVEA